MKTQTQTEPSRRIASNSSPETVVGFAVLGCLVAGAVGIIKALSMDTGFGVLLCLLASVASFSTVYYIYCGKD
jgi:hypothetical protein